MHGVYVLQNRGVTIYGRLKNTKVLLESIYEYRSPIVERPLLLDVN